MLRRMAIAGMFLAATAAVVDAAPRRGKKAGARRAAFKRVFKHRKAKSVRRAARPALLGRVSTDGTYDIGGDELILVATEFRGSFTRQTAEKAFLNAFYFLYDQGQTMDIGRYNRRLAKDRHVVFGWYNVTRRKFGFVAFHIRDDGRSADYITDNGRSRRINDWTNFVWPTNGYRVQVRIADDDRGGVAGIFSVN